MNHHQPSMMIVPITTSALTYSIPSLPLLLNFFRIEPRRNMGLISLSAEVIIKKKSNYPKVIEMHIGS